MTQQFQDQGGAATMDPKPLARWLTSTIMARLSRPQRRAKKRAQVEKRRIKAGQGHSRGA
jgi:RNA:NAD 2'-phosphotransferase (TPT1/KptA family)